MSECKCGEWDKIGYCVKCGEHFTDRFDKLTTENQLLRDEMKKQKLVAYKHLRESGQTNQRLLDEIQRLRDALEQIARKDYYGFKGEPFKNAHEIAEQALQEIGK